MLGFCSAFTEPWMEGIVSGLPCIARVLSTGPRAVTNPLWADVTCRCSPWVAWSPKEHTASPRVWPLVPGLPLQGWGRGWGACDTNAWNHHRSGGSSGHLGRNGLFFLLVSSAGLSEAGSWMVREKGRYSRCCHPPGCPHPASQPPLVLWSSCKVPESPPPQQTAATNVACCPLRTKSEASCLPLYG